MRHFVGEGTPKHTYIKFYTDPDDEWIHTDMYMKDTATHRKRRRNNSRL